MKKLLLLLLLSSVGLINKLQAKKMVSKNRKEIRREDDPYYIPSSRLNPTIYQGGISDPELQQIFGNLSPLFDFFEVEDLTNPPSFIAALNAINNSENPLVPGEDYSDYFKRIFPSDNPLDTLELLEESTRRRGNPMDYLNPIEEEYNNRVLTEALEQYKQFVRDNSFIITTEYGTVKAFLKKHPGISNPLMSVIDIMDQDENALPALEAAYKQSLSDLEEPYKQAIMKAGPSVMWHKSVSDFFKGYLDDQKAQTFIKKSSLQKFYQEQRDAWFDQK